jgi:hypothetical protein
MDPRRSKDAAVARVWRGWAAPETADDYERYVAEEVLPGQVELPGYLGAFYHRRSVGDLVEFLVITRWSSFDDIVAFAGEGNPAQATIPQKAADMLVHYDAEATHYADIRPAWPEGFVVR